jgi:protein-disulfide isomerase
MADGRTTRERAAQARAEQLAAEKRSQRRTQIIGAAVVFILAAGIIGVGVIAGRSDGSSTGLTLPAPDPQAARPAGALGPDSATPYGVPVGDAAEAASLVEVWEDFQCPYCAQFERSQGAELQALGESGEIRLVYRVATFLDGNFPEANLSSARAANAWGAAIDAGVGEQYHALVFANQPEKEGTGYTDEQLLDFGKQVGLTGAEYDAFAKKVSDRTFFGWVSNSSQAFRDSNVPGTPHISVDGQEVPSDYLLSGLVDYINSVRKQ